MKKQALKPQILTNSGVMFDFENPLFNCNDVGHALAHINRFTGHTFKPINVAAHSLVVTFLMPRKHWLIGLVHDITEAYLGDIATPLKQLLKDYQVIEARIEKELFKQIGVEYTDESKWHTKTADMQALLIERSIYLPENKEWPKRMGDLEAQEIKQALDIYKLPALEAKDLWLQMFNELITTEKRKH